MKTLFNIIFCCLTFDCFAQTFEVNSVVGKIQLSNNYVNVPPFGHKKVEYVVSSNSYSEDIYSWVWVLNTVNYHFEAHNGFVFLIKTSNHSNKTIETIKILPSNESK